MLLNKMFLHTKDVIPNIYCEQVCEKGCGLSKWMCIIIKCPFVALKIDIFKVNCLIVCE